MVIRPWITGNIPGGRVAVILKPEAAGKIIKKAKNPLFITGSQIITEEARDKFLLDYAAEIAKKITTVATSDSLKGLVEKEVKPEPKYMGLVEVVDRLTDPNWGVNRKPHDIIIFLGIHYYLASQGLSTLKHYALHLRTMTLCNRYHPNAYWSFGNIDSEEWKNTLDVVIANIK